MPLEPIEGRWAGAWVRVRAGLPPFVKRAPRSVDKAKPRPVDPYAVLGVSSSASLEEVRAAFRKRALEHHPDHGGSPLAFMAVKRAYDAIVARRAKRRGARRDSA